jgi:hypothetical protein
VVDGNYVKSLLPPGWSWLYDYLPYAKALAINSTTTFCAADPPTWSLPNAGDLYNFLSGGYATQNDVVTTFINNLTKAYLWYSICQCTSGATPTPAAPPAPPANLPGINPGQVVTSPANACAHFDSLATTATDQANGGNYMINQGDLSLPAFPLYPLPTGSTTAVLVVHDLVNGAHHGDQAYQYAFFDSARSAISTTTPFISSGVTNTHTLAIPSNAVYFLLTSELGAVTFSTDNLQATLDVYCGGALPGGQSSPCCPPDPIANGLLQQAIALITLIQRQIAPFGYILSTVHPLLTGTGSFAVSGLLGLQVTVTAGLPTAGSAAGTPVEYFTDSFVSLGTADGYPRSQRIDHSPQLWLPPDAGAFTLVGYTLRPGLTATITEVTREP